MYAYYWKEIVLFMLVVSVIACNVMYIYNFIKDERRNIQGLIYLQAFFIVSLLLFYVISHHISVERMETGLRENFIPNINVHHLDALRYNIYDGFGDAEWYKNKNKETTPDFLGVYDLDTGTFSYYVKLNSFDILKR